MEDRNKRVRIIIAGTHFEPVLHHLKAALPEASVEMVEPQILVERIGEADVLIPAMMKIGESIFARARDLRLVQQWGAGLDGVDIKAATRHGVAVANVPTTGTGNAESVAEWCVMAAISLSRRFPQIQEQARRGHPWGSPEGQALLGRTAAFVGFGGIGKALAVRLRPFGMRMIAVKRRPDDTSAKLFGLEWISSMEDLPRLLERAEYLFLCLPLTPETQGFIGHKELSLLPRGAFLINPARGAIVSRPALIEALDRGHLGGVALDVFWSEPTEPGDLLLERPNVLATPHIAGVTDVSYGGIASKVVENIHRVMAGKLPLNCANPDLT
jgi:phosphoglycerate dehydrogenase-like enzyme